MIINILFVLGALSLIVAIAVIIWKMIELGQVKLLLLIIIWGICVFIAQHFILKYW